MGPSDDAWNKGVEALGDAPLSQEAMVPDQSREDIDKLSKMVHELGGKAGSAAKSGERARVYGELLTAL